MYQILIDWGNNMPSKKKPSPKHYTLYLDESTTYRYNPHTHKKSDEHFCMAGIIIPDDDYNILQSDINSLKNIMWNDYPVPEDIILHQKNISDAEDGRLDIKKFPEYKRFSKNVNRKIFYSELKTIFTKGIYTVIGGSIGKSELDTAFSISGKNNTDEYLICLQMLLENYCHFLCLHNGIGRVIYESRELKADERLRDKFYHIKLMGSMYIDKSTTGKRLLGIDIVEKSANCAGLQLADFVPNSFAREHTGISQSKYNIFATLKYFRYDGNIGDKDRFGVKYML